jgi:hypothetical protein
MPDAQAWLGKRLQPSELDSAPELGERAPDQAEVNSTDDPLMRLRRLRKRAAVQPELTSLLACLDLRPEAKLILKADDLGERLAGRNSCQRPRPADQEGSQRGSRRGAGSRQVPERGDHAARPRRRFAAVPADAAPRPAPRPTLPRPAPRGGHGPCSDGGRPAQPVPAHQAGRSPKPAARESAPGSHRLAPGEVASCRPRRGR